MLGLLALVLAPALAGAGSAPAPGSRMPPVEGQIGLGAPVVSPDGRFAAVTRWNNVGLWVVDLGTGSLTEVSEARGAGFHPAWGTNPAGAPTLYTKAVVGGVEDEQVIRWSAEGTLILAEGARLGQPAPAAGGHVLWTTPAGLDTDTGKAPESFGQPGAVDLVEPSPDGSRLAWDDANGVLHVRSVASGRERTLGGAGVGAHPAWSPDGRYLLHRTLDGQIAVVNAAPGALATQIEGTHPAWSPAGHTILFDRVETAESAGEGVHADPYSVLGSSLWSFDLDSGREGELYESSEVHARFPAPIPGSTDVLFVDSVAGGLWRLSAGTASPVRVSSALFGSEATDLAPVAPPPSESTSVDVPYMHQLWDTPDDFDGGWSCGPTSCVQTIAKWSILPNADITCSWPSPHTSHWGWYIPNNYSFNGYNYDVWGVAKGGNCQGAHGFICREYGGAIWAEMTAFLQQHHVDSWQAGTSFDTVVSEVNAGYPLPTSSYVLGYGHILVIKGYLTSGGSAIHSILVNDPYGNAGTGSWGNDDGESAVYDWPGYNNGYLEITISQLFVAHGSAPPVESEPVDTGSGATTTPPADTGTPATADTGHGKRHDPPGRVLDEPGTLTGMNDVGGCNSAGGPAGVGLAAAAIAGRARRRRRG